MNEEKGGETRMNMHYSGIAGQLSPAIPQCTEKGRGEKKKGGKKKGDFL